MEDPNKCVLNIVETFTGGFQGLTDCGLLANYSVSVQLQSKAFTGSYEKFKLISVVNDFIENLQKLMQNFSITDENVFTDTQDETNSFEVDESLNAHKNSNAFAVNFDSAKPSEMNITLIPTPLENSPPLSVAAGDTDLPIFAVVPLGNANEELISSSLNTLSKKRSSSIVKLEHTEYENTIDTIANKITQHHLSDVGWQCDMCQKSFSSLQHFQEHCREEHRGAGCFECNLCGTRLMTKLSLTRHIRSHTNIKTASCEICGKSFKREDYLVTHYKLHKDERPYKCTICNKTFTAKTNLNLHIRIHTNQRDFHCEHCGKTFTRRDKLREHVMRHFNIKKFECSVCKKRYAEKRDLRIHLKIHM